MPRATFSQIVNRSMSEVIVRSLATSFSTLLPVTALMIFGGETLRDFAFALLVGVASGAYSSIFIAAPVLTLWKEREPTYVRRRRNAMAEHDGAVPAFSSGVIDGDGDGATPAEPGSGAPGSKPARRERKPVATGAVATEAAVAPTSAAPETAPLSDEDRAREDAKARRARNRARKKHGRH
jgi:SecD/SecF fusion protein